MATRSQVRAHRADVDELVRIAGNDLNVLFRQIDSADELRDALRDLLPRLVGMYGSAAATLGADWYDELRELSEARGRFRAIPAELPDAGRADALAGWAVAPMYQAKPDKATTLVKVAGGLQRIIANADRFTVTGSAVQDPRAGWVRVGDGGCDWCAQYLDGEVHYVEGYDFDAHDHCRCAAVPEFT